LPGAGAQIKIQETELSLTFKTGSGAVWEVAPAPGHFPDTNGFAKLTEKWTYFT